MIILALALISANPDTISSALAKAQPGDTIKLTPGDYGTVSIKNRVWPKRITINAAGAKMRLVVSKSSGITINGGTFGPNKTKPGYAAHLLQSSNVTFYKSVFVDSLRGLVIDRSQDVKVSWVRFSRMTIDGVNIASSQRVQVTDSKCEGFTPGEAHPDCIQGWSRPDTGITSDVLIARNTIGPGSQGIFFGNGVRNGLDDGGYDRVTITANKIHGSFPQGIGLYDCRACTVSGNVVTTAPGSRFRTSINVVRGTVKSEANTIGPKQ